MKLPYVHLLSAHSFSFSVLSFLKNIDKYFDIIKRLNGRMYIKILMKWILNKYVCFFIGLQEMASDRLIDWVAE